MDTSSIHVPQESFFDFSLKTLIASQVLYLEPFQKTGLHFVHININNLLRK